MIENLLLTIPPVILCAVIIYVAKTKDIVGGAIGSTIIIIIMALALMPAISSDVGSTDWQYDDYRIAPSDATAFGSIEIVELDGKNYLHAKDVGEGGYSTPDYSVDVTVNKAQLDVFLLTGQSNAAYKPETIGTRIDPEKANPIPPFGTAYYYGTNSGPITYTAWESTHTLGSMQYLTNPDGTAHIGGIECAFSAEYYSLTAHKVYTINCSKGDTSVTQWVGNNSMYLMSSELYQDAISQLDLDKYEIHAMPYLWVQGESDNLWDTSVQYMGWFLDAYNQICSDKYGEFHPTSAIISLSDPDNAVNSSVAQRLLAQRYPDMIKLGSEASETFTQQNGLLNSDNLHYTQAGRNIIGLDLARCAART